MAASRLDTGVILEAAAEEFALHGFEGMSMRRLAERLSATAAALYYHFSSKEALYDEVCNHIFDSTVFAIEEALKGARTREERMERFVATLFDAWDNSTLLVLTQRDVINANIRPERSVASPHYRLLFGLIRKIQAQHFDGVLDESLSYAFGSLLFGYCSLLAHSRIETGMDREAHRRQRKEELLALCRRLLDLGRPA